MMLLILKDTLGHPSTSTDVSGSCDPRSPGWQPIRLCIESGLKSLENHYSYVEINRIFAINATRHRFMLKC